MNAIALLTGYVQAKSGQKCVDTGRARSLSACQTSSIFSEMSSITKTTHNLLQAMETAML